MDQTSKRHIAIVEEGVKILNDYPEMTHAEALTEAKRVLGYEEVEK